MVIATRRSVLLPVLILFILSPFVGEMLGASLRVSYLDEPVRVIAILLFYGAGALLLREIARRFGLGWPSVICLGLAFGLIEEGLTLQTIFNPGALGYDLTYGRTGGVNWLWAILIAVYHAIWSIAIPIAIAETIFPAPPGIVAE